MAAVGGGEAGGAAGTTTSHAVNAMTVKLGRPRLTTGGVEGPPVVVVVARGWGREGRR